MKKCRHCRCAYVVVGINLFMVATHEIGHALGLAHSTVPGSLMSRWHRHFDRDFVLPDDDVAAIQQLYGQSVSRGEVIDGRSTTAVAGIGADPVMGQGGPDAHKNLTVGSATARIPRNFH